MTTNVEATVSAFMGGTLNFAVITTGGGDVHTMIGDDSSKSADLVTDSDGRLSFTFVVNAFPGTAWKLTLTRAGAEKPQYERSGLTDHKGVGHDEGTISF